MTRRSTNYPRELRERALRLVAKARANYDKAWATMSAIARQLGIDSTETLRKWVRRLRSMLGSGLV